MNKQEALKKIEELKEFVENYDKQLMYAVVKYSDKFGILLENKEGKTLVDTWDRVQDLNDFKWFNNRKTGHFWIHGDTQPFEIINKQGEVIFKSNSYCKVRFLKC